MIADTLKGFTRSERSCQQQRLFVWKMEQHLEGNCPFTGKRNSAHRTTRIQCEHCHEEIDQTRHELSLERRQLARLAVIAAKWARRYSREFKDARQLPLAMDWDEDDGVIDGPPE
jgi:hypothetical protein